MTNKITFLNEPLFWPVLIGAAVVLVVFIWKDWVQSGNRRFLLKSVLAFFAVASLALIALKPALPSKEAAGKFVLLTSGHQSSKLDSLKKRYKKLEVQEYKSGQPVSNELRSAENVFVLGHGLKAYDLWQLEEIPVTYLGGSPPKGVVKLHYRQENSVGDKFLLKGLQLNPEKGNRLVLQGPGGAGLDSVSLNAEEKQNFQFEAELKVEGNYIYNLLEKDSLGAILSSDPVPLKVAKKNTLRILVLNSFPSFETKYLKNFLAEAGHELTVKSQITRGRFKYEFFNTGRTPLGTLSENILQAFDLLILDAGSLNTLSSGEMMALEKSVRETGLGVFIQPGDGLFSSPGRSPELNFESAPGTEVRSVQWPGDILTRHSFRIREEFGLQPVHTAEGLILSAYMRLGQGRIGSSVFTDTYQLLLLDGKSNTYRELWSQLIENISKKEDPAMEWEASDILGFKEEPFDFKLRTADPIPVVKNNNGNHLSLTQKLELPFLWTGTTWPRQTGWNTLRQDTTAVFDFYVSDTTHWRSLAAYKDIAANKRYFDRLEPMGKENRFLEPISLLWFFGLFLICVGGVWLEPKL